MPPLIIAHRGDSSNRPENTLAAFAAALELGTDLVEADVQLTGDLHVVVLHDPALDRTTTGHGDVRQATLADVRAVSAGYPARFGDRYAGERVPTLAELLGLLRGRARLLLEIKPDSVVDGPGEDGIEARTIAEVRKADMSQDVALVSFDRRALERCHRQAPEITRGCLFHKATPRAVVEGARAVATDLVLPERGLIDEAMAAETRAEGLKLATWVVDDPEELRRLARFDLYGIATNRPGEMMDALWESE
jgi:glycerophosphoryl diester phosphodiesterase